MKWRRVVLAALVFLLPLEVPGARAAEEPGRAANSLVWITTALQAGESWTLTCTTGDKVSGEFAIFEYFEFTAASGDRSWSTLGRGANGSYRVWGSVAGAHAGQNPEDTTEYDVSSSQFSYSRSDPDAGSLTLAVALWGRSITCSFVSSVSGSQPVTQLDPNAARIGRLHDFEAPGAASATLASATAAARLSMLHQGKLIAAIGFDDPFGASAAVVSATGPDGETRLSASEIILREPGGAGQWTYEITGARAGLTSWVPPLWTMELP